MKRHIQGWDLLQGLPSWDDGRHIINIDIIDNPEDATIGTHNLINIPYKCHCILKINFYFTGAFMMRDLVTKFSESEDLDDDIDEILHDFESSTDRQFLHSVIFY